MELNDTIRLLDRRLFEHCWRTIGATQAHAFEALAGRYSERHRVYHDAEHIAECLEWHKRLADLAERPDELAVAVYFHDAVYALGAANNEAASATLFRSLAKAEGVQPDAVERVVRLIESTASHDADQGDAALLGDIDLAILGSPPARYQRYERAIRREYAAVSDPAYRAGRRRVLEGFLSRPAIYRTPRMAAQLEQPARHNLRSALGALSSATTKEE